mmetsp:Transcript_22145/g.31721  ORF Transcript_22145/g.31721 Transcript_22145/m.31721 type:complete len:139 (+) Transcript_22145:749-1165(+)
MNGRIRNIRKIMWLLRFLVVVEILGLTEGTTATSIKIRTKQIEFLLLLLPLMALLPATLSYPTLESTSSSVEDPRPMVSNTISTTATTAIRTPTIGRTATDGDSQLNAECASSNNWNTVDTRIQPSFCGSIDSEKRMH